MRVHSIAGRLAAMFGLAAALVGLVAGVALYVFQSMELERHKQEELQARFDIVERLVLSTATLTKWTSLKDKLAAFTPDDDSVRFIVNSRDPRFAYGETAWARAAAVPQGFGMATDDERKFRTLSKLVPANGERPDVRLTIALDRTHVEHWKRVMAAGVLVVSLLAAAAVTALGWWIARRGLAPVDRLSDHARRLGEGDLALRLPTDTLPSELEGLVLTLNGALDRLQQSYQQLSTFNSDVAHELRTPLGNLIGETQVALSRSRTNAELEAVLQSNLEDLERLRSIINDMLFLARADQGAIADNLVDVSLAEETRKSADFMDMVFEEAAKTLTIEGDAEARVNRSLFMRAITNLLDNAVRHGSGDGAVTVTIADHGDDVSVAVANQAAPIAPEHLARLFDRFYRIDPARKSSGESYGLGLAVVKAVALMHGGTVFAQSIGTNVLIGFTLARGQAGKGAGRAQRRAVPELSAV